jgi:DNA helicase-2/ATP-dependent DNA helicase PcrA
MNKLTLAVAGGRKTQSIVDECLAASPERSILVLTYTQVNQHELATRLARSGPPVARVDVQGWFSFLMGHWVRPYLPSVFPGRRLRGLNFEGDPGRYATSERRFLDDEERAYKRHLSHLALDTYASSAGAVLDRLSRIYDTIYIDEVQDLNGYDLEVLQAMLISTINLNLVGDVRQALLLTNAKDPRNKQYKGAKIVDWFQLQAKKGRLSIEHQNTTWRCNALIAAFADTVFGSRSFPATVSANATTTEHDGVFAVATSDACQYLGDYEPLCLRHSAACLTRLPLPFLNIGVAKGMSVERVLIGPTAPMVNFLTRGTALEDQAACSLYVAATRARASVAFVHDRPQSLRLPVWRPSTEALQRGV